MLATQSFEYLEKLSPHLLPTTLANVKQFFMFRLSAQDARIIAREMDDVTEEDVINLETHSCYVKLVHGKYQQPTFSLELEQPALQDRSQIEELRARSRRYTRGAQEVEEALFLAMARALRASTHQHTHYQESTPSPSFTAPENADSHQKGNPMRPKPPRPPMVDGMVLSPSSSSAAQASTVGAEREETSHQVAPPASSQQTTPQMPRENRQQTGAKQEIQEKPARYIRFEKGNQKQQRTPQKAEEEITSFDLHPIEEEQQEGQERAP